MTIEKLKRIGNTNRFHVYGNGGYVGIFLDEILVKYAIKSGAEFEDATFAKIKAENDARVSFDLAAGYLEKYVVSRRGIEQYLRRKGFDGKTISAAVKKLQEYGLIDDEKFAKNLYESLSGRMGQRAIAQKLKSKGVSAEIVETLLENVDPDQQLETATALAEKFCKNRQKDAKIRQKCLAHLVYKGYDYSVAQKAAATALQNLGSAEDEQDDFNNFDE